MQNIQCRLGLGVATLATTACGQTATHDAEIGVATQALVESLLVADFETGLGPFDLEGSCGLSTGAAASGEVGLRCDDAFAVTVDVSTVGHTDIQLRYTRRTNNYAAGEVFAARASYDGGETFEDLEVTGNEESFQTMEFVLPSAADDNPNVVLRFSSEASGFLTRFDLDDLVVEGDNGVSDIPDDCDGIDNDGDGQVDEDGDCGGNEPEVLLFDSFENLDRFTESGEGDWNVEAFHSTAGYPATGSGVPAAHSDNFDSSCQLTLTTPLDLSGATTATLELLRFVDVSLDANEFLSVELFDGTSWNTEFHFTDGAGDDDVWHAESLDLGSYVGVSDFRIRFSTSSSSAFEHVQVDDLRVTINGGTTEPDDFAVSGDNLHAHVAYLTQQPRSAGSAFLETARTYCADQLAAMGYQVERMDFSVDGVSGQNVIGTLTGGDRAEERVLVSAHVDSVGNCDGADDNASGVAGVLETARLLAQGSHRRTAVVACWDAEEINLVGSRAYAQRASAQGEDIVVSLVYEMIGYYDDTPNSQEVPGGDQAFSLFFPAEYAQLEANQFRGDFIVLATDRAGAVNSGGGEAFTADIANAANTEGLSSMAVDFSSFLMDQFDDVMRSDHSPFWDEGYSAVMITDSAELRNPNYHCSGGSQDTISTLDFEFMRQVTQATSVAARNALDD